MSYILDALRRADAERERSESPGLHTQQLDAPLDDDERPDRAGRRRWIVLAGVAVIVAAALGWVLFGRDGTPGGAAPGAANPAPPALVPAAPPSPPVPAPVAPAPVAAEPVGSAQPALVTSLPPIPPPTPRTPAAPAPPPAAPAPARAAAAAPTPAASAPAPAPEARIPTQAELPDELRREIPALVVGGAMYSPTPANRMLILNGQLAHEGDQLAPGLVLEHINLKAAVLRYKGQAFRISY